ncbi:MULTISPECIES: hypothetical protein [unclassified Prochlorococcus]|uniref:hypothetical protein n=1 Tax=unclassified Prochlorococcus TaxID=2627481 RepID=UPI0005337E94|nr:MULTISPECIES: hypothetical protein [unclassified Prochlorococcus]KGG14988.1 hypothetical protein EV06_1502 [Prochlorococcus sp. MIT 0602]KGG17174.1 hypothetical protein EV07_0609 [Prochlorococcus sp. MIT 0603]
MTTSNKNAKGHKRIGAVLGLALVSSVVGLSAMTSSAEAKSSCVYYETGKTWYSSGGRPEWVCE